MTTVQIKTHKRPSPWHGPEDGDLFRLAGPIGFEAANARDDVIRAQILLSHAGAYDLDRLGGPTGWAGGELVRGIRSYQKRKGLTVDGLMLPDGETMQTLREDLGETLSSQSAPRAGEIDTHHEIMARHRAQGDDEAPPPRTPIVMPGEGLPAFVRRQDAGPGEIRSDADDDRGPAFRNGAQVAVAPALPYVASLLLAAPTAIAAGEWAKQQYKEYQNKNLLTADPLPPLPPSMPPSEKDIDNTKTPPLMPSAPSIEHTTSGESPAEQLDRLLADGRRALWNGVQEIFGTTVTRNETDNTRLSSNIIVQECEKVIAANTSLKGFRHEAGASVDGKGVQEKAEIAIKNGVRNAGGGGHSFPDVLYVDDLGRMVAINSATEYGPGHYIGREVRSFAKLVKNMGRWVASITGKKRPDESIDDYRERARGVCEDSFGKLLKKELENSEEQAAANAEPQSP